MIHIPMKMENRTQKRESKYIKKIKIFLDTNRFSSTMGCASSSPVIENEVKEDVKANEFSNVVVTSPAGIVRQVTITLSSEDKDDILISKCGEHYVIQGTKIVVNMNKCTIIGYLDVNDVFHNTKIPLVQTMCIQYDMDFEVLV